jgi:hypothetical protein
MLKNGVAWAEPLELIEYCNIYFKNLRDSYKRGRDVKNLTILQHRKELFRPFLSVGMGQFHHLLHQTLLAAALFCCR